MKNTRTILQTLRHEAGLSQEDLAYLLGGTTAGMVCRHEKGERAPTLEMGMGYSLVLGTEVQDLFEDLELQIKERIKNRARVLCSTNPLDPADPRAVQRRETLERLGML